MAGFKALYIIIINTTKNVTYQEHAMLLALIRLDRSSRGQLTEYITINPVKISTK